MFLRKSGKYEIHPQKLCAGLNYARSVRTNVFPRGVFAPTPGLRGVRGEAGALAPAADEGAEPFFPIALALRCALGPGARRTVQVFPRNRILTAGPNLKVQRLNSPVR